jgi:WhiB family redox-sensing transcriptional regulator
MAPKNRKGLSLVGDKPFRVVDEAYYEWSRRGTCNDRNYNPDLWFTQGKIPELSAKRICNNICPVREECLAFALTFMQEGVWGGTTDKERNKIRLERQIPGIRLTTLDLSA